ncbi:hypothetical protein A3F57_03220 [Candidatus Roizmanbacteria bacterium RIFCSPHIGHO2_12_FULL_36_11]|uniref:Uncharacterized protein n=1 Tax=Candidatus Curtissbacteria bacterium RIFCSPLOWO2_01_FULL_37_9 TaxID=1797724 RepID=A0A1F5GUH2_9BACT|nr:MAG: hypothetical protein A3A48_03715 [Candidatus Curtissbacteria bacterium RIFCSPLOWO2_01_FULL_37_9]OGK32573.1 MAG: hypothetical protein A3F57_03220 [Candidatus Roizmanbacteria bacterium RIFCSPHIGHO2_12_FULL_36_11]
MENDIKMKVLKRRYLKEYGVNAEEKSIEDVLIELQQLKEKVKNLETVKSKTSPKKIIFGLLEKAESLGMKFPKKQKKLLKLLSSLKPVKNSKLEDKIPTKNLKTLRRDTRKRIEKYVGNNSLRIKSTHGYTTLEILTPEKNLLFQ